MWIMLQQASADAKVFIWWLWGLCGPRRNHGKVWKMLLLSMWGGCSKTEPPRATGTAPGWRSASPRGYFKVSESNPTLGLLPYPCQEHGPSLGQDWTTAINNCLLYFSICTGRKKILHLVKGVWEMWWEQSELILTLTHSAPAEQTCLYGKVMWRARLESQVWRWRCVGWCVTAKLRGEIGGFWGSEKQCPAALTLWRYNMLLSSPLAGTQDTTGCDVQELLFWARWHAGIILLFYMDI